MCFVEKLLNGKSQDIYPKKIFANQLITVDDLFQFKKELLEELIVALKLQSTVPRKKWMKSHEVRLMLKISPGKLQTLKSSGAIPYSNLGGLHLYDYEEIDKIIKQGQILAGEK